MLEVRLLGGFAVQVDGTEVPEDAWRLRKARALVKLLAIAPAHRMHREQASALLWPDKDDARALNNNLHQAVYAARRALDVAGADGSAILALRDDVLALNGEVAVDAVELESAIAVARADGSAPAYEAALAGAAGDLLPEDRYEDWTTDRRDALRELVITAHLELAALQELPDDAAEVLQRALALDPLHERATRLLMRAYADAGRRQRALEAFEHLRGALRDAYAADPDEETRRLYRELLSGIDGDGGRGAPLPLPMTSFVGRERELGEVARLLGRTRLLTITGPGGSGKTRLALEAAARQQGEIRLVELAPLADPALLPSPVAAGLGVSLPADADPVDALARAIGPHELLLVLDNCEHLVHAAAELAAGLLARCPGLRILATSREPLHIDGEVAWRAPSLSLPADHDGDPRASEAVRLFADRAAAAAPELELGDEDIEAAAAICRRLDGMPLAIELAAARIRHLSPAQLAERLGTALDVLGTGSRTALDRQQTLRATLDWSYELLDDDERALFAALSVFAGDFDIAAAEAVGGKALDVLGRLVDKSLVLADRQAREVRYHLLETFRQYGREHLAEPAAPLRAHRRHYLALAERLAPAAELGEDDGWIRTLTAEHPNLRAAIASGLRDDPQEALRLVTALRWFWLDGGHLVEGLRWYARALEARPDRDALRARALTAAGFLEFRRGRHAGQFERYPELLDIERERGEPTELAKALLLSAVCGFMTMQWEQTFDACAEIIGSSDPLLDASARYIEGLTHWFSGSPQGSAAAFALARSALAELPDDHPAGFTVLLIGLPVVHDFGPPRVVHEETLATFRDCGPRQAEAYIWLAEALIARFLRDDARAGQSAGDAVERFRSLGDRRGTALALGTASCVARSSGDAERAWSLLRESQELRRATGDTRLIGIGIGLEALLEGLTGEPDRARSLFTEVEDRFMRQGDTPGLGGALLNRGTFELAQGDLATARDLLGRLDVHMRYQRLDRAMAWVDVARAEINAVLGDMSAAHTLLDGARVELERLGEPGGRDACAALEARLQSPLSSS